LRTSKKGNAYVSVKLKDPSFHGGTIHPVLVKTESGYVLDWKPRDRLPEQLRGQRNLEGANAQQANRGTDRF